MGHLAAPLIPLAKYEPANNAALLVVLLKCQLHSGVICPAATETSIRRIRPQFDDVAQAGFIPTSLLLYFVSSYQRYPAALCSPDSTLPFAHLYAQQLGQGYHPTCNFLFI